MLDEEVEGLDGELGGLGDGFGGGDGGLLVGAGERCKFWEGKAFVSLVLRFITRYVGRVVGIERETASGTVWWKRGESEGRWL